MQTIKKIVSYFYNTEEQKSDITEEQKSDITNTKNKKRKKTYARKLKDKINKKRKKRHLRNKQRCQDNIKNNIKFGYESPPEYPIDKRTHEDIYNLTKKQGALKYYRTANEHNHNSRPYYMPEVEKRLHPTTDNTDQPMGEYIDMPFDLVTDEDYKHEV
jgi:hypothetical protein